MPTYDGARAMAVLFYEAYKVQISDSNEAFRKAAESAAKAHPMLGMSEGVLIDELIKDLQESYSTTLTMSSLLKSDDSTHIPWLKQRKGESKWPLWRRYERYLRERKKWSPKIIQSLDETTDTILELLEDPEDTSRSYDRRGVVVGYVQSGKTANFTGLINKSFDAGFKLIIVLTGMHKNLRSQTQLRLDEEVLGYETSKELIQLPVGNNSSLIGVSTLPGEKYIDLGTLTSRDDNGDFNRAIAKKINVHPGAQRFLLVVKKNASVLKSILSYFRDDSPLSKFNPEVNRKTINNVPLLIIDDECDQASINTTNVVNENGEVSEEYDPTTINRLIREIYITFEQRAYVGYTATPFANIFIHDKAVHPQYGPELFPKDFILSLPKPSNYIGPAEVFGLNRDDDGSLALVRPIRYYTSFVPPKHKSDHRVLSLPESLIESIYAFILSTTIRRLRGQKAAHNSMLIHVTRFKDVQNSVYDKVKDCFYIIKQRIRRGESGNNEVLNALYDLWQKDYIKTTRNLDNDPKKPLYMPSWDEIQKELMATTESIDIKKINGSSKDVLDYKKHSSTGLNVIAIGGDKLSRGLTLEGLTISYYLRASEMYDTLMQMGRWFGYRDGYLDLCRIYTTKELTSWFQHISSAFEELRDELQYMEARGKTPEDFGLKVQTHPVMDITSQIKMRASTMQKLSYSASVSETTVFELDNNKVKTNFEATDRFIASLGESIPKANSKHFFFENVPSEKIINYLSEYETAKTAPRANSKNLRSYIQKSNEYGELISWTVVLMNVGEQTNNYIGGNLVGDGVKRHPTGSPTGKDVSVKRLLSGTHEYLDFSDEQTKELIKLEQEFAEIEKKNGKFRKGYKSKEIRSRLRKSTNGLMLVYSISHKDEDGNDTFPESITYKPIGLGLVFPESKNDDIKIDYRVNNVYMELGEEEEDDERYE